MSDKLVLSRKNYVFTGVCGGISEYFDVDSTFIRFLVVLFGLLDPLFVSIIYFLLYLIMPEAKKYPNEESREALEQMRHGNMNEYSSVEEMKQDILS